MITGTTATMLRSGLTRSCVLQPLLLRSSNTAATTTITAATTASPYSTFPAVRSPLPAVRSQLLPSAAAALSPAATNPSTTTTILLLSRRAAAAGRRHASTSSTSTSSPSPSSRDHDADAAAAARAAQRATSAADPRTPPLDWNTFFQLRKSRRRWQVAFSVVLSLASGTAGAMVLSTGAADSLTSQVPLDPIATLGLMTIGFVALGWLAGPSLGSAVFYVIKRKYKVPMTVKESQFFARIKKNRVDPSNSSTGNPVPDFYGEKISSVAGYRQWLKDQRAYNKKRTTFI